MTKKKAIVLLSGGLDSTTCLAIAGQQGFACYAQSFRYGQRHAIELEAAARVAAALGAVEHLVVDFDLRPIGGSALTDPTGALRVPKGRDARTIGAGIPVTYVPARNTIFLSFALCWAEVIEATDIFIGVNALDYSGYPDCRPAFISAFESLAVTATRIGARGQPLRIHAPLMRMNKAEIIRTGVALGVDYGLTHSCYDPDEQGRPCGDCDACILRRRGFTEAGMVDPATLDEQDR